MTVAAVEELADEFDDFCGVVVCGGGLKQQWGDQIAAFTCEECCGKDLTDETHPEHDPDHRHVNAASCIVIDGDPEKRMALYERALAESPRYVIVGYDQTIDDNSMVLELPQMFVVLDEVTTIKNPGALITECIRETFGEAPFRFGLTGTPMENGRPEELFQIMVWVDDSVLGRDDLFDQTFVVRNKYGGVREYQNLPLFHEMMQECSVSIDADDPDVRDFMPTMQAPKRILVEFDAESARVYELMSEDLAYELAQAAKRARGGFDIHAHYTGGSSDAETQGKIMSKISCMRMLCASPDQLINSAEDYLEQLKLYDQMQLDHELHMERYGDHGPDNCPAPVPEHKCSSAKSHKCPKPVHHAGWPQVKRKKQNKTYYVDKPFNGSAYAAELLEAGELDRLDETPKLDEVMADIDKALRGQCRDCEACDASPDPARLNKIVVFSYHKLALRVLERVYEGRCVRYDGDMSLKVRNAAKKRFQQDPDVRLFFTSDAGGYGVDLPQANHLYNLDKPFTAGRVTQRNARIRRANLDHHTAVSVRDYLIWNSLEVYYADITAAKERVVQAVRTGKGHVDGKIVVNAASLGAYIRKHRV